jgi:hypothetical protein
MLLLSAPLLMVGLWLSVTGAGDRNRHRGTVSPDEEVTALVMNEPHSRYPVLGDTVDDDVGVVHVRDLLTAAHSVIGGTDSGDPADVAPRRFPQGHGGAFCDASAGSRVYYAHAPLHRAGRVVIR